VLNGSGGLLQITDGKSRAARRMLPLVPSVFSALKGRQTHREALWRWAFPADTKSGHLEGGSAKKQHAAALKTINEEATKKKRKPELPPFPPYCLRHTALTNLAAAGCDAFTLHEIAAIPASQLHSDTVTPRPMQSSEPLQNSLQRKRHCPSDCSG